MQKIELYKLNKPLLIVVTIGKWQLFETWLQPDQGPVQVSGAALILNRQYRSFEYLTADKGGWGSSGILLDLCG